MMATNDKGCASLGLNPTSHDTSDDSHAAPVLRPEGTPPSLRVPHVKTGFFALHRINPHHPPLVWSPSIPLSFNLATVFPQAVDFTR